MIDIKNQLFSRTAKILIYINKNPKCNFKDISDVTGINYNFVANIVSGLEDLKLLNSYSSGRERFNIIEPKGKIVAELLEKIQGELQ